MKIFIINLQRSADRRQVMQQKIAHLGQSDFPLEFIFFNAIDARAGQHQPYEKYLSRWRMKFYFGRLLSEGEIGCYASHFALWKKCLAINEPVIILEDDVRFCSDFFAGIKHITQSNYDYIRLSCLKPEKTNLMILQDHFYATCNGPSGTQGYYLSPKAAKQFSNARYWIMPVDNYLDTCCLHKIKTIIHVPYLLAHDNEMQSTIGQSVERKKPNLLWKSTRETNRLIRQLRMLWYICWLVVRHRKFFVKLTG